VKIKNIKKRRIEKRGDKLVLLLKIKLIKMLERRFKKCRRDLN